MFTEPRFVNEDAARDHLEALRWPKGAICPHCGGTERNTKLEGKSHRAGLWTCGDCRRQFSVTVGTVFERSKIPLHKWVLATHLLCASKKGMSSHQLHRMLGVTYKTAWFMSHRIREAFELPDAEQLGKRGPVEVDETVYTRKWKPTTGKGPAQRIFSLVERDGTTRSFHVANVKAATLKPIMVKQIAKNATLYTDSAGQYKKIKGEFPMLASSICNAIAQNLILDLRTAKPLMKNARKPR
jgi:transposase-like protein